MNEMIIIETSKGFEPIHRYFSNRLPFRARFDDFSIISSNFLTSLIFSLMCDSFTLVGNRDYNVLNINMNYLIIMNIQILYRVLTSFFIARLWVAITEDFSAPSLLSILNKYLYSGY